MNTFAFTTIDFIVIGIIAFSAILGLIRGFIREAFSFVGFAIAMYVAYHFSGVIATKWLTAFPGGTTGQHALAFIGVFLAILILSKIISNLFSSLVNKIGLSFLDRLLGAFFGAIRGGLIIIVLSTLFALTDIPKSSEWKDALTKPGIEMAVGFIRNWLPDDWADQFKNATDIRQLP
jgi:membrane protein required for colicin V production